MVAKVFRLDKKRVKIEYSAENKPTQFDIVCHTPGKVDQANLFIMCKAIEWEVANLHIICVDEEISEIMMVKAKSVFPYRGTIEIHVPKLEVDESVQEV